MMLNRIALAVVLCAFGPAAARGQSPALGDPLAGTQRLTIDGDISESMIRGVDRFLLRELERSVAARADRWRRDTSSPAAYTASVEPNRAHLRRMLGLSEQRNPCPELELITTTTRSSLVGRNPTCEIHMVRWASDDGLHGEGLLLRPVGRPPIAGVVALPDCEQTPEMLAGLAPGIDAGSLFALKLADSGCLVLVPTLINRRMDLSVIADGQRRGKVTHREMLYRAAFQMGRHLIGYEVQKVLAAIDCLARECPGDAPALGIVGYGEGGMIALYAGALDLRIQAVGVSGYFNSRQTIWQEPIDRNVFGLLREFGDAELASLIAPRSLFVEAAPFPSIDIPAGVDSAPAQVATPAFAQVRAEVERARQLVTGLDASPIQLVANDDGEGAPGSVEFLTSLLQSLGGTAPVITAGSPEPVGPATDAAARHARQFHEMSEYNERLVSDGPLTRAAFTAKINRETNDIATFAESTEEYRAYLRDEIIGRLDIPLIAPNPRTRLTYDDPAFLGYEVVIDIVPDVVLYGTLLVPKDLQPGQRRPVVVCQHGLEGRTEHTVTGDKTSYRDFAARLAQRGFITFSPQHLYRGGDLFRTLQRKANPLGKSLFAVMILQHEQLLQWLASVPAVDPQRIAFYGISYGGKSAMRIPAVLDGYCLSICSSDFSDWIWRTVSNRFNSGYLAHAEYEIFEFALGSAFNYSDLAALICPRPFMVEDFHHHGIAADRARGEYGRVELMYENLGIADRTRYTHFAGWNPMQEHGERVTFDFLHEQLNWPER